MQAEKQNKVISTTITVDGNVYHKEYPYENTSGIISNGAMTYTVNGKIVTFWDYDFDSKKIEVIP